MLCSLTGTSRNSLGRGGPNIINSGTGGKNVRVKGPAQTEGFAEMYSCTNMALISNFVPPAGVHGGILFLAIR